jgi:SAM-dependent methyltransferase
MPITNKSSPKLTDLKYKLYEASVQEPEWHTHFLPFVHQFYHGRMPKSYREDFCGTAMISHEWVKRDEENVAVGVDLDPTPLSYAKRIHTSGLTASQKKRLKLLRQNVLKPTQQKFDLVGAYNFSFCIFHKRAQMLQYFRSVYRSLNPQGSFFLELAGGQGMQDSMKEKRSFSVPGVGKCLYVWEQLDHDPIQDHNDYYIHFKLPSGRWMKKAFHYSWRLWGVRELREILEEAGFSDTVVLWETANEDGVGSGEYIPLEKGDNDEAWIAYVVGIKR